MRFILTIFLFTVFIFGNQKITNPKTGEEVSLYNKSWDTLFQTPKINIIKTSLGLGINIEDLILIAAKRMDRNTNDWSFVVEFDTFLGRDYGLPE